MILQLNINKSYACIYSFFNISKIIWNHYYW